MKNSSKKKKLLAVAAALAIIAVLSGTFAWLTAQDQRINRAESAAVNDDSVTVKETRNGSNKGSFRFQYRNRQCICQSFL